MRSQMRWIQANRWAINMQIEAEDSDEQKAISGHNMEKTGLEQRRNMTGGTSADSKVRSVVKWAPCLKNATRSLQRRNTFFPPWKESVKEARLETGIDAEIMQVAGVTLQSLNLYSQKSSSMTVMALICTEHAHVYGQGHFTPKDTNRTRKAKHRVSTSLIFCGWSWNKGFNVAVTR